MYFANLGSSSSGNCSLFFDEKNLILIDCGFSYKYIREKLKLLNLSQKKVDFIILTHEHIDHVRSLRTFIRKENPVIFASNGTTEKVIKGLRLDGGNFENFVPGDEFIIKELKIESFPIPHDGVEPSAFTFRKNGKKLSYVLDIGYLSKLVKFKISDSDILIIESNYDYEMLIAGPYTIATKERIKGRKGHLSNEDLASYFREEFDGRSKKIFLGHISKVNNTPKLALKSAKKALNDKFKRDFDLIPILPKGIAEIIKL